jgi:hypothetical protein
VLLVGANGKTRPLEPGGYDHFQPVTREFIRGPRGSLKGEPSAISSLLEERKRERTL